MVERRKMDRKILGLADARVRKRGGREGEWVGTGWGYGQAEDN